MAPTIPLLFSFTSSSPTSKPQHSHDLCIQPLAAPSPTQTLTTRLLNSEACTRLTASQRTDRYVSPHPPDVVLPTTSPHPPTPNKPPPSAPRTRPSSPYSFSVLGRARMTATSPLTLSHTRLLYKQERESIRTSGSCGILHWHIFWCVLCRLCGIWGAEFGRERGRTLM